MRKLFNPKSPPAGTTSSGPLMTFATVPDGTYSGVWGCYQVTMDVAGQTVLFDTPEGINGSLNVKVTVSGGIATVTV